MTARLDAQRSSFEISSLIVVERGTIEEDAIISSLSSSSFSFENDSKSADITDCSISAPLSPSVFFARESRLKSPGFFPRLSRCILNISLRSF